MPELRTDWLTGRTVLIAENRAHRPNEFSSYSSLFSPPDGAAASAAVSPGVQLACPFCPGNEANTPPAGYEQCDASGAWRLRVIPNKYPALSLDESSQSPPITAFGAHEVIVETPRHIDRTSQLSQSELRCVLEAYATRLNHWRADPRFAYGLAFKNQGHRAGASLSHLHSQLVALPFVPLTVAAEQGRAREHFDQTSQCAYCEWIAAERSDEARMVADVPGFVAFCPSVSIQPLEVWILPSVHAPWFETAMDSQALDGLAALLHPLIQRSESLLPDPSFNLLLRTAPWHDDVQAYSHWRIELLPRMNSIAGLETATGIFINPIAPERAAAQLREALA